MFPRRGRKNWKNCGKLYISSLYNHCKYIIDIRNTRTNCNSILWCRLFQRRFSKSYFNVRLDSCLPLNDFVIEIVEVVNNKLC